jgi:hypothetical protein
MNKDTIVVSAFRVHRSEFSCSLAAALLGTRRVSARQGWAGEKSGLFEHPGWYSPAVPDVTTSEVLACPPSFPPTASHDLG